MKQLNPIIEALDGIDEDIALAAAAKRRRMKKPLRIAIVSVAAALLLGTTAAAATMGEHPIVKFNNKTITPKFSSYVDDNGWKIDTTVFPYGVYQYEYDPVGEIRGVYDVNAEDPRDETRFYDELGIELNGVITDLRMGFRATKEGEIDFGTMSIRNHSNYHQSETENADGTVIKIDLWQDPVQIVMDALSEKAYARMTLDEKIDRWIQLQTDYTFPGYGGFAHPTLRELFAEETTGTGVVGFKGLPSDAAGKYYDYKFDQPEGFTEKEGLQVIQFSNDIYVEGKFEYTKELVKADEPLVIQQIFIYTMTDDESGKDVKFTVWRSAEEKDVDTSCFKFDYDYITLKNGTEARIHQSADYNYIVEFEKDGAAYAFVCGLDMELVNRVLENMRMM